MTTAAAAAEIAGCGFDCPVEDSQFSLTSFFVWVVLSLLFAIPGFFAGMLIHRKLIGLSIWIRLTSIVLLVPLVWFAVIFGADIASVVSNVGFVQALRHFIDQFASAYLFPEIISGSFLAAFGSFFDSQRVNAERSSGHYASS